MQELFWPMFSLFVWTILVSLRSLHVRISAVRERQVRESYFEIFAGDAPEKVIKTGNNLRNLTEFPPLFYIVILMVMMSDTVDATYIWLAWAYVAFRILHSLVHLGINKVRPRLTVFIASQLVLLALWGRLGWQLMH